MELAERTFRSDKVQIITTTDGEIMFKCKDLAKMLGYDEESTRRVVKSKIPKENKYKLKY